MPRFTYSLRESLKNMVRHPLVTIASITTIALTLLIVALFSVFSINASAISKRLEQSPPVEIYTDIGIDSEQLDALKQRLRDCDMVKDSTYYSPERNLEIYRESMGNNSRALEGLSADHLPHSFIIHLRDASQVKAFQIEAYKWVGVRKVSYEGEVMNFLGGTRRFVNVASITAFIVLCIISFFIISNMVRISVLARGQEISIMKYIGATTSFIRRPYVIEGILVGILGAVFALLAVFFTYRAVYERLMRGVSPTDTLAMVPISSLMLSISVVCFVLGCSVGAIGSAISVRRYAKV
ncbi:MAG: permease-like cell division protein FtsX [Eubacteriales bacterium]|nr:permease-like cell division protein FtsX [Eubacteriales bacterium]